MIRKQFIVGDQHKETFCTCIIYMNIMLIIIYTTMQVECKTIIIQEYQKKLFYERFSCGACNLLVV